MDPEQLNPTDPGYWRNAETPGPSDRIIIRTTTDSSTNHAQLSRLINSPLVYDYPIFANGSTLIFESDEQRRYYFGDDPSPREETMLDIILRLYYAATQGDVRAPLPHIVGPPGCGKSESVEKAAELLGVGLHIINVSRMSPLEIEGVQMPINGNTELKMLTASWWQQLRDGDIVLLDEFLRGFPEVYNGLLDILTSRRVGAFVLPKVFFIAASNSIATYDKALEDRLLHLYVPDIRTNKTQQKHSAKLLVEATGMLPDMITHYAMEEVLKQEIFPTYKILDAFKSKANISAASIAGHSLRHLIGQVQLRQIESVPLRELISANNREAMSKRRYQFVILPDGKNPDPTYLQHARKLVGNDKLTEIQARNLDLNLQLVDMEIAMHETITTTEDENDPLS